MCNWHSYYNKYYNFFLSIQLCNIFVFFYIYRSNWKKLWHSLMLFFEEPIVKQIKMSWKWPLNNTYAWYEFKQNIHIKWNKYIYIIYKWSDATTHITCDMHEETYNSFCFEFFFHFKIINGKVNFKNILVSFIMFLIVTTRRFYISINSIISLIK
jgi:hypothetical protein